MIFQPKPSVLNFRDPGKIALKGISEPVEVFELVL
jgi:hypothetical protein